MNNKLRLEFGKSVRPTTKDFQLENRLFMAKKYLEKALKKEYRKPCHANTILLVGYVEMALPEIEKCIGLLNHGFKTSDKRTGKETKSATQVWGPNGKNSNQKGKRQQIHSKRTASLPEKVSRSKGS